MMSAIILSPCNSNLIYPSPFHPRLFLSVGLRIQTQIISRTNLSYQNKTLPRRFFAVAVTKGSAESSESEETIPSWAKPDSEEPPPWARDDDKDFSSEQSFEIPFYVYLLASSITAIAAIGSIFEYVNQRPVFGILNSDSIFYAPLLGFFAFTGVPTSAFLWFKSVQVANKEAEEQDRRDGFL